MRTLQERYDELFLAARDLVMNDDEKSFDRLREILELQTTERGGSDG